MNLEEFHNGIRLFNSQQFFDAHEVWEDVWREAEGGPKKFLQGMIQVAVAFHHHSTGNLVGARSLLGRAQQNLLHDAGPFGEVDRTILLDSVSRWHDALTRCATLPPFPSI